MESSRGRMTRDAPASLAALKARGCVTLAKRMQFGKREHRNTHGQIRTSPEVQAEIDALRARQAEAAAAARAGVKQ